MSGARDVSLVTEPPSILSEADSARISSAFPAATCHIPCRSRCGSRDGPERNRGRAFAILYARSRLRTGPRAKHFLLYARRARAHPLQTMAWSTSCQNLHHCAQSDPIEASALLHLE